VGRCSTRYGEVIGLATAIFAGGQNLNFAVAVEVPGGADPGREADDARRVRRCDHGGGRRQRRARGEDRAPGPDYDVSLLDGCTQDQLAEAAGDHRRIEIGAPLYNEATRRVLPIYEGAALNMEKDSGCVGIRRRRAPLDTRRAVQSDTEKAFGRISSLFCSVTLFA